MDRKLPIRGFSVLIAAFLFVIPGKIPATGDDAGRARKAGRRDRRALHPGDAMEAKARWVHGRWYWKVDREYGYRGGPAK